MKGILMTNLEQCPNASFQKLAAQHTVPSLGDRHKMAALPSATEVSYQGRVE